MNTTKNLGIYSIVCQSTLSPQWFCSQIWLELINNFKKATIFPHQFNKNILLKLVINLFRE